MKGDKLPEAWKALAEKTDPPATAQKPSLVSKLAEVMAAVERVPKRGHNQHFNYDFATESDITAAIRNELAKRQIMMVPYVESLTWRQVQTRSGVNDVCCAMVEFSLYDGETGDALKLRIPGEGQDAGDKCVPKALTSALKFALLKLFMIPTGDDPERDTQDKVKKTALPVIRGNTIWPVRPSRAITAAEKTALTAGTVLLYEIREAFEPAIATVVTHLGEELPLFRPPHLELARQACVEVVPVILTVKIGKKTGKPYVEEIRREKTNAELDAEIAKRDLARQASEIA